MIFNRDDNPHFPHIQVLHHLLFLTTTAGGTHLPQHGGHLLSPFRFARKCVPNFLLATLRAARLSFATFKSSGILFS